MTNELKDIDTNDKVPYERNDNELTKVKWSIETNDVDNYFLRDYENMHKSMEDRQINDFYEAQRNIQSTMMGDTAVKTVQNRQCICCAPFWNLPHFKMVLHHFGIPKWGTHFETVLHHFGTPSLAPFQNSAAPFWNIYFFNLN